MAPTRSAGLLARQAATLMTVALAATKQGASNGCLEEGVAWEPLNMEGTQTTLETDAWACQRKCLRTKECYHFTFEETHRECHLQDVNASRQLQDGYTSGAFQCWSKIKATVQAKGEASSGDAEKSYLPHRFRCLEVGVSWEPALKMPKVSRGTEADAIMECQDLCAMTKGCLRFTAALDRESCYLAERGSRPLPAPSNSVSGPPFCGNENDAFMKHFELEKKRGSEKEETNGRSPSSWTLQLGCFGIAASLAMVAVTLYRRRAHQQSLQKPLEGCDSHSLE